LDTMNVEDLEMSKELAVVSASEEELVSVLP
jgi:hypothetical protein